MPTIEPRISAAAPHTKVIAEAESGDISPYPQLSPVAAESRELARARAAASPADSTFEQSLSAAVSSMHSFTMRGLPLSFSSSSPLSAMRRTRLRNRLFAMVAEPMMMSTASPAVRHISVGRARQIMSENVMEIPSTAADIRSMTAADRSGIRIPLLQQAAAARNMWMLIFTERKSSYSKISNLRLIICI